MNIVLPFSQKYLRQRYGMNDLTINMLEQQVLPNLVTRFSMDNRVNFVEVVGDVKNEALHGISSKISIIYSDTSHITTAREVMQNYFGCTESNEEIFVFLNPLFPFVSVDKVSLGYSFVFNCSVDNAIGGVTNALGVVDQNVILNSDQGIFTVIRKSIFEENKEKLLPPVDVIGLSAIELISLRSKDDLELYNLIINSGLMT